MSHSPIVFVHQTIRCQGIHRLEATKTDKTGCQRTIRFSERDVTVAFMVSISSWHKLYVSSPRIENEEHEAIGNSNRRGPVKVAIGAAHRCMSDQRKAMRSWRLPEAIRLGRSRSSVWMRTQDRIMRSAPSSHDRRE